MNHDVPWARGDVDAIAVELRHRRERQPGLPGAVYAAATGMVRGIHSDLELSTGQKAVLTLAVLDALDLVTGRESAV